MLTIEQKTAIANATWEDIAEYAKSKGYDPLKEPKVISQRDKLMSNNAKLEYDATETNAKIDALTTKNGEKDAANTALATTHKEFLAKFGDNPDELLGKIKLYEEAETARQEKTKENFGKEFEAWKTALDIDDEQLGKIVPELPNEETKLAWMENNRERILGIKNSPVLINEGVPDKTENLTKSVEKFAGKAGVGKDTAAECVKFKNNLEKQRNSK